MRRTIFLILLMVLFIGCKNKTEKASHKPIEIWSKVEMKVKNQEIFVYSFSDTAELIQHNLS